jgi:hypothetical protein
MLVQGMSFSHAASIAFACMAETFRKNEVIPSRDGFEYSNMMASFPPSIKGRGAFQFKLHKTLTPQFSEEYSYPTDGLESPPTVEEIQSTQIDPTKHPMVEVRVLYRELLEMQAKKSIDDPNFSQEEYDKKEKRMLKLMDEYELQHPHK